MRRWLREVMMIGSLLFAMGLGLLLAPCAFGQNKGAAPAPTNAPAQGGVTMVNESKNIFEYGMVIVMFGGALFAVCRSSRRN